MARVLLIESDTVFAAVLADRLHVAGHEVRRLADGARAAAAAVDEHADLVVVDDAPNAGLAVVKALRGQAATRGLPILMLADRGETADRLAALRAGVDDYVTRPCDLEELLLRLERLAGSRGLAPQRLQGDLASHPVWEVLQFLAQARKTGVLSVKGTPGAGTLELRDGEALAARWQRLHGREALLALLSLEEGSFRFDPHPAAGAPPAAAADLRLQQTLLDAAWLKDELGKRRTRLPATGQPLHALTPQPPDVAGDFQGLPLRRVFDRVLQQPGVRLFDLIADGAEAPLSTRLAVALLVEQGALAMQTAGLEEEVQNTREISTALLLDLAVEELVEGAGRAGFTGPAPVCLLLVEAEAWPALHRLLAEAPGFHQNEALRRLAQRVEQQQPGDAELAARNGRLSLQVQRLAGPLPPPVGAALAECAGVLVWVRSAGSLEAAREAVQRLEAAGAAGATGVLVAGGAASGQVADLIGDARRWRGTPHEPQSLLGVLRLLQPPES